MQAFGKYRGRVAENIDPGGIGRLKVVVPALSGDARIWALPCVPFAGPDVGFWFVPPVGSSIWVEFEGGDVDHPIWTGCFWEAGQLPQAFADVARGMIKTETALFDLDEAGNCAGTFEASPPTL